MNVNGPATAAKDRTFNGPWDGDNQIVIGFDIGTTQSGVAFAYLVEGHQQQLHRVNKWPGQEDRKSSGKVPTLVWYDSDGKAVSFGAEALTPQTEERAEEFGWRLARHFKLHLHPPDLRARHSLLLEPLPPGVPLRRIYSNFLNYLLCYAQEAFERTIVGNAKAIWNRCRSDMVFVIAHPNGWGIREQAFLRDAAVGAGFTSAAKAGEHIRFVTEAEASTHFCMHFTHLRSCLYPGINFVVCDAGGSTVDTTLYTAEEVSPRLRLSERKASACVQAGAIFVDQTAELYLRRLFESAGLSLGSVDEYVSEGMNDFEAKAKRIFGDATSEIQVKVGGIRLKLENPLVRRGQLKLSRSIIQSFFDPYIKEILASVESQVLSTTVPHILLVGGFGESPYLYQQMKAWFEPKGCQVTTTDEPSSKAVADGAVIWHCINYVVKRVPRFAYGIEVTIPFDPTNMEHYGRTQYERPSGTRVKGGWSQIIAKGLPIGCDEITRQPYIQEYWQPDPDLANMQIHIYGYSFGTLPEWMRSKSGKRHNGFQKKCTIIGNLNGMRNALQPRTSASGVCYWVLNFNVCIRFGRTEIKAFLEWIEGNAIKTGPANIIADKLVL